MPIRNDVFSLNISLSSGIKYDVIVGSDLPDFVSGDVNSTSFFVVDRHIDQLYIQKYLSKISESSGFKKLIISPFSGEENKTYQAFQYFCEELISGGITRKDKIIIIGGGAIGDAVHFVGSSILRGVDVIRIPTTLLSMTDSSVGGKTGINSNKIKNAIGSFSQPKLVICDVDFIATQSDKEFISGYLEGVKHMLIADKNESIALLNNPIKFDKNNKKFLTEWVKKNVAIKYSFIKDDEFDSNGSRAIVNFGHTVGHAIEKYENESIPHGHAVGIGMVVELMTGYVVGFKSGLEISSKLKNHLIELGVWVGIKKYDIQKLFTLISADKKLDSTEMVDFFDEKYGKITAPKKIKIVVLEDYAMPKLIDVAPQNIVDAINLLLD